MIFRLRGAPGKIAHEAVFRLAGRLAPESPILVDRPVGQHFHDAAQLRDVLHGTVDQGDALVAIEHSLEMAKTADWIVDMGFEVGDEVVAQGAPEQIARNPKSYTGRYLKPVLARKAKGDRRAAE